MSNHDVAWAAGFFEGEGYVAFNYCFNKQVNKSYPRFLITIAQVHREPLDKFREIFNTGTVRGPYGPYKDNKQAFYSFQVSGEEAKRVVELMMPLLFHKGEQARAALSEYYEYTNK